MAQRARIFNKDWYKPLVASAMVIIDEASRITEIDIPSIKGCYHNAGVVRVGDRNQ